MLDKEAAGLVLVVDDDPAVRTFLRAALEASGATVLEATNGNEALALARTADIQVAIVDLVMPERDGLETIRDLRRLWPAIRTVAISGALPEHYLELASRLGADAVFAKPIQPRELISCISGFLHART